MTRVTIIFFSILSCACAKKVDTNEQKTSFENIEIAKIYEEFKTLANEYDSKYEFSELTISYNENIYPKDGVCNKETREEFDYIKMKNVEKRVLTIVIRRDPGFTETEKTILLFHELGHCLLNREHVEGEITFNGKTEHVAESIMFPSVLGKISDETYESNKKYYLDELFLNK